MMKKYLGEIISTLLIILGILSAGMGLKGFLLSSRFIDGGVTGVSMLTAEFFHQPLLLPVLLLVFNLPFIALGFRQVGAKFAIKSAIAIAGLALAVYFIPYPDVTPDSLLTAVFGGVFIGAGIGLAIRGGAVLDGTEIAAILLSRKSNVLKVSDIILIFNVIIFIVAAFGLGVENAMYSILTYFTAAKTIEFLLYGIEQYHAIIITSDYHKTIRKSLIERGRSVTIYKGQGGASDTERDILYVVLTRLEIGEVKRMVKSIDPGAFIIVHNIADAEGGLIKRSGIHETHG